MRWILDYYFTYNNTRTVTLSIYVVIVGNTNRASFFVMTDLRTKEPVDVSLGFPEKLNPSQLPRACCPAKKAAGCMFAVQMPFM